LPHAESVAIAAHSAAARQRFGRDTTDTDDTDTAKDVATRRDRAATGMRFDAVDGSRGTMIRSSEPAMCCTDAAL
jgi:hypothetical protein